METSMEALGVLIPLAIVIGSIWFLMKTAKQARETYGFGMVVNWSFALVVLGLVLLFVGLIASSTPQDAGSSVVYALAGLGCVGGAGVVNVKRSNPKFGSLFTVCQVVAALGIIAPIILLFSQRSAMRGINNIN